jgi:hypothetical protein
MMFCVYLTIYLGNKLPPFYIGSTSLVKISGGYNGTVTSQVYSATWVSERKNNPHLFKTRVLSRYPDRASALQKEMKLQLALNVVRNPLYINRAIANKKFINQGPLSVETKNKISASKTGVKTGRRSEETRMRQSMAAKGKSKSAAHRASMSAAFAGRVRSAETIEKHRAKMIGRKVSDAARKNISNALKNPSDAVRATLSAAQRKRRSNISYKVSDPHGNIHSVNSMEDFCSSIGPGAYPTSFLRTLVNKKPISRGPFAGWQVLNKRVSNE